jgi:hypothetical protein
MVCLWVSFEFPLPFSVEEQPLTVVGKIEGKYAHTILSPTGSSVKYVYTMVAHQGVPFVVFGTHILVGKPKIQDEFDY